MQLELDYARHDLGKFCDLVQQGIWIFSLKPLSTATTVLGLACDMLRYLLRWKQRSLVPFMARLTPGFSTRRLLLHPRDVRRIARRWFARVPRVLVQFGLELLHQRPKIHQFSFKLFDAGVAFP